MIKVFIPENKGKIKTSVRGFWRNDKGITFYDYLRVKNYNYLTYNCGGNDSYALRELNFIKAKCNQEAVFFKNGREIGFIYNDFYNVEILSNRIYAEVLAINLRTEIKEALRDYKGVTIYKVGNKYFKEIFYK